MSENLFYRLGRGSLREAKESLSKLMKDIGEVGVYLDESSLEDIYVAVNELHILENIEYLKGRTKRPGSINLDFFTAYIKSRSKVLISDREIEEYKGEVLL